MNKKITLKILCYLIGIFCFLGGIVWIEDGDLLIGLFTASGIIPWFWIARNIKILPTKD